MHRRHVMLAAIVAASASAAAEEAPTRVSLTLGEAVERARSGSAQLAQLHALARAADADERGARALRLPQVDLHAGYTRQSDVPELTLTFPGQAPRTIFPNIPDNYRFRAGATLPLYTGGRVGALLEAARREHEAAGADERTGTADLVLETATAYWSLVTSREAAAVLEHALGAYEVHLGDARNRERFGLAARNEVLAVEVERDRAELARLRTENAAALAEANLARLVDLPAGTTIEARDRLDVLAAAGTEETLAALVEAALARRPERSALAARVQAAEARARVEKAARLPQAGVAAGFDYANPNRRILPPEAAWNDSWDVSVNVTWTPFDGGRARAAADRASARAEAVRRQLDDLDRRVRLQVTQRHLDLGAARRAVEVAARSVASATENARVAGERHRAGVAPSSDRLDAEVGRLRAELDHKDALAQQHLAAAALDRAVGR
jgi:outer membrane protein